jgi:hypothetical protein
MERNIIFTVCNGRCGQYTLSNYINKYSTNTISEIEPPETFFQGSNVFSRILQSLERKYIHTDEDLGRGKFIEYYDKDLINPIKESVIKKIRRIEKILKLKNKKNYFEISKFFIRSYCEEVIKIIPNLNILYLFRNPIVNARSFVNRNKNFNKDNFLPNFKKTIFKTDLESLSDFEKYLWVWIEIELRYKKILDKYNIKKFYALATDDLNKLEKIEKMFSFFNIKHNKLSFIKRANTNLEFGFGPTIVSKKDLVDFQNFVKKIPSNILNQIPYFVDYNKNVIVEN